MADDESTSNKLPRWTEASDPDGLTREDIVSKDWMLTDLVEIFTGLHDDGNGSFSVTLLMPGGVVSGTAISASAYREAFLGVFGQSADETTVSSLRRLWDLRHQKIQESLARREKAQVPLPARSYIHLRDVKILANGQTINVPLWRGSLSDVAGWNLGSISA